MKKIALLVAVIAIAASCKKDLTCNCDVTNTYTSTTGNVSNTSVTIYEQNRTLEKVSKGDGRSEMQCYNYTEETKSSTMSGTVTTNNVDKSEYECELK